MKKILTLIISLLAIVFLAQWLLNIDQNQNLAQVEESSEVSQTTTDSASTSEASKTADVSEAEEETENQVSQSLSSTETSQNTDARPELPQTQVMDNQGQTLQLPDLIANKPTIINFWASWCPPCRKEMPYLQSLYEEYSSDINFIMVNATQSKPSETIQKASQFIEDQGYTFPVYFDHNMSSQINLGVRTLPSTLIVDQDGKIVYGFRGLVPEAKLREIISELQ